jgi:DNA-binding CsgD family transcriptional regulator
MPPRLRREVLGQPLSEQEHDFLYERAMQGSRKAAAVAMGMDIHTVHHLMASIFAKLGVEDVTGAYRAKGWLHPLPYGVSAAEMRHEQLGEGEVLDAFWDRMKP